MSYLSQLYTYHSNVESVEHVEWCGMKNNKVKNKGVEVEHVKHMCGCIIDEYLQISTQNTWHEWYTCPMYTCSVNNLCQHFPTLCAMRCLKKAIHTAVFSTIKQIVEAAQMIEDVSRYHMGTRCIGNTCKGNLSATVEYHTELAEGKSKEKILRIPQPQGEYSIYCGNLLGHGNAPCLPNINPDCTHHWQLLTLTAKWGFGGAGG